MCLSLNCSTLYMNYKMHTCHQTMPFVQFHPKYKTAIVNKIICLWRYTKEVNWRIITWTGQYILWCQLYSQSALKCRHPFIFSNNFLCYLIQFLGLQCIFCLFQNTCPMTMALNKADKVVTVRLFQQDIVYLQVYAVNLRSM